MEHCVPLNLRVNSITLFRAHTCSCKVPLILIRF